MGGFKEIDRQRQALLDEIKNIKQKEAELQTLLSAKKEELTSKFLYKFRPRVLKRLTAIDLLLTHIPLQVESKIDEINEQLEELEG